MTSAYCQLSSPSAGKKPLISMREQSHPGQAVRHDCLEPRDLTVTDGAKVLGVCRQALSNLVNGKAGISAEMAIRLSKAFGGTPEDWLHLQMTYDLAQARKLEDTIKVHTLEAVRQQRQPRLL